MSHLKSEAFGYIKDMFIQHNMVKRTVLSFISVLITGFAISLFSLSGFGVDPFTSMNMNISSVIGMSYGTYQLIVNIVILVFVVIVAHRGLVGVGTVFNMILVGYTCEFFEKLFSPLENSTLPVRLVLLAAGIIMMCFSSSLFFTANVGVGPYDTPCVHDNAGNKDSYEMDPRYDGRMRCSDRTGCKRRAYCTFSRKLFTDQKYRDRHGHNGILYGPAR